MIAFLAAPGALEAKPSKPLPFKGQMTGTDDLGEPDPNCAFQKSVITGTGTATHLGVFTVTLETCAVPFELVPGSGVFGFSFPDGVITAVAADGSELVGTFIGSVVPTETTATDGLLVINGAYTLAGTSGHLEGATSAGTFTGTENIADFTVALSLTGIFAP